MEKMSNISVNQFESVFKAAPASATRLEFDTGDGSVLSVDVRTVLPLEDMVSFVNEVVDACFDEDGNYYPEYQDYMFRRCVLARYGEFRMPSDHRKAYRLIYGTPVYAQILDVIDADQCDELRRVIDRKIEYRKQILLSGERETLMKASAKLEEMSASIASLTEGVDMEAFMRAVSGLSDALGDMPREQVIHALVEAVTKRQEEKKPV